MRRYRRNPSPKEEASDPNTTPERLHELAADYPFEVLCNPVMPLIAVQDPSQWLDTYQLAVVNYFGGWHDESIKGLTRTELKHTCRLMAMQLDNLVPFPEVRECITHRILGRAEDQMDNLRCTATKAAEEAFESLSYVSDDIGEHLNNKAAAASYAFRLLCAWCSCLSRATGNPFRIPSDSSYTPNRRIRR